MPKIFYFSPLLYCLSLCAYALDDVSLPERIRQEQRLKELGQHLQEQLPQLAPQVVTSTANLQQIIVVEQPCVQIDRIQLVALDGQQAADLNQFQFILTAIKKHPQHIIGQCMGSQSLHNLVNFAQNELIKAGFITSQVVVNPQDLNQGELALGIQIGRLHQIKVQGEQASSWQIKTALPFRQGDIVNLKQLDQGLENLKRVFTVDIQIVPALEAEQELAGYSDLLIQLQPQQNVNFNLTVDNSGSDSTGKYIGSLGISFNDPLRLNDILSLNFSHSLDDLHQNRNKNLYVNYQIPFGYLDVAASFSQYRYDQSVLGYNGPILYRGDSAQTQINLSRVISRSGEHKTSLYGKLYHKENKNFIDEIEVGVQRRQTSGWHVGLQHRHYLGAAVVDASLDYRHGTGAFNALLAPEEKIEDIYNNRLPAEGYSRAPIWQADLRLSLPFLLLDQAAQYRLNWHGQYAPKLLVPNDRFYIGGRYSVRGFDGDLMLSGDHGHYLQQEINLNSAWPNTQFYLGIDQGWVNGNHSLPGQRYLMGSVLGLRSYQNSFYLDVFGGRGLIAPESIKKDWMTGFSLNLSY
ncbi:ShlB/FhaC/HecB family hemolysin secretion/activation protein [Acinetobacter puyangensis]|uniref:Hemolysin activation/secretion protein n=1 Tax=Acinetobacter puyangensis TaxID=1096779 RepID=A0A240ECY8_9GAMM|nr:ShlB/FhaC/HecB family hemolysin secretion/activation protein [Acinetobacter puyangensis]SNX45770.1 Hemolysin activation/secretion protein [Acinetobacter puyangensis]